MKHKGNLTNAAYLQLYVNHKSDTWTFWRNLTEKGFDESKREEFLSEGKMLLSGFRFDEMKAFYDAKIIAAFDDDIKKFICFLVGQNYFDKQKITIDEWMNTRYFINPIAKTVEVPLSILEAVKYLGGQNYIREGFSRLHWFR